MGKIISVTDTPITTIEGKKFIRRQSKVQMPNGRFRYPIIYFDATPGTVRVTREELEYLRVPVYKQLM